MILQKKALSVNTFYEYLVYNIIMEKVNKNKDQALLKKPQDSSLTKRLLTRILFVLLIPAIGISIFFAVLFTITKEENAKETLTLVVASAFSPKGLDDETEIIEFKKKMDELGTDSIVPIEGLDLKITKKNIEEFSPRDIRINFFGKISDILYSQDGAEIEKFVTSPDMRENLNNTGFLSLISANGHEKIQNWFFYAFLVSILGGFGVYFLNKGLNGLKLLAKVAVFASIPGLIFSTIVKFFISSNSPIPFASETQFSTILANVVKNALPSTIEIFFRTYLWVFICSASIYASIEIYVFWKKLFKKKNV